MNDEIAALIELHQGLERLGPGDTAFSMALLDDLPPLPATPRIADLGCGSGASALLLARHFQVEIRAVDLHPVFLRQLEQSAGKLGLGRWIKTIEGDMGKLDWPCGTVDLIWSEGAAYNLTFPGALGAWRPLLAPGGLAVVSELSWFTEAPSAAPRQFWEDAYPTLGSEETNIGHAERAGFDVLATRRLPAECWWTNYYGPLRARIEALRPSAHPALQRILAATEVEVELFERHSTEYGYTFYVLRAT